MGTILPWPVHRDHAAERKRFKSEPTGEIVFFTGVRYERAPAAEPAPILAAPAPCPSEHERPEPRRA